MPLNSRHLSTSFYSSTPMITEPETQHSFCLLTEDRRPSQLNSYDTAEESLMTYGYSGASTSIKNYAQCITLLFPGGGEQFLRLQVERQYLSNDSDKIIFPLFNMFFVSINHSFSDAINLTKFNVGGVQRLRELDQDWRGEWGCLRSVSRG